MIIGLTGATGFIGRRIIALARERDHEVIGFTRNPRRQIPGCIETREFSLGASPNFARCEAVIHLAGENVFGLWTEKKRRRIMESRTVGTRRVVEGIARAAGVVRVLVSSSAIGFYGDTGERETDEESRPGTGFLADVSRAWEAEAQRAQEYRTRVVLLRTAIVLGRGGGAMALMIPLFKGCLGGKLADGKQWMAWVHLDDVAGLALFAVENDRVTGPVNATAPNPVRNDEFTRALAKTLRRPAFLTVPRTLLRKLSGDFSHELLDSKRVVPRRTLELGYEFRHPALDEAVREIVGK